MAAARDPEQSVYIYNLRTVFQYFLCEPRNTFLKQYYRRLCQTIPKGLTFYMWLLLSTRTGMPLPATDYLKQHQARNLSKSARSSADDFRTSEMVENPRQKSIYIYIFNLKKKIHTKIKFLPLFHWSISPVHYFLCKNCRWKKGFALKVLLPANMMS